MFLDCKLFKGKLIRIIHILVIKYRRSCIINLETAMCSVNFFQEEQKVKIKKPQ